MNNKTFFEQQHLIQRQITVSRYKQLNQHIYKGQCVFAGSSLAEQFPIYEMLTNRSLDLLVYNRGVSGDTIDEMTADLDTLVLALEPSKLFINIGSNDLGSDTYDEDQLFNSYCHLLERIHTALPNCMIHVLSYYPVNPEKNSFLDEKAKTFMFANRTNDNIEQINARLAVFCQTRKFTYINVHDILLDDQGNLHEDLTVEGIHLWPTAYEKILDQLLPYL